MDETRRAEADLVARCRGGDLQAFEEIYRQHATRLYNLACRMSGSAADAEDLLQEIFLLAYRKLSGFRGESSLGTWLHRLAVNLCLDRLRSREVKIAQATGSLDAETDYSPESSQPIGDRLISRLDLERALEQLPPSYRAAFLLHDVEGFQHQEIAGILDIAEGSSKSLVHKARLRMRRLLAGSH